MPQEWSGIETPLRPSEWASQLHKHPDVEFQQYLVRGMREGFRLGIEYGVRSAKTNMKSAMDNPGVVSQYLEKEKRAGRLIGPLKRVEWPEVQVNRFGVIPKPHQPCKWRLIVDLSHPKGFSVNDGIEAELCSLKYTSVEEAVKRCQRLGPGMWLTKLNVEAAYRIVPVHPRDRHLLGMVWQGALYLDTALPFGLRSAPKIFNALADGHQWILEEQGVEVIHYLDDFLFFEGPKKAGRRQALDVALATCARLGVPIATHKTEGPTQVITFLGIELDTRAGEVRLPKEKLTRLQREIRVWDGRRSCNKRELLSLIGQLQHASSMVRPGRTFLRHMITLSAVPKELHHRVRLNAGFRSDLAWWNAFIGSWNGRRGLHEATTKPPSHRMPPVPGGAEHIHHLGTGSSWSGQSHGEAFTLPYRNSYQ